MALSHVFGHATNPNTMPLCCMQVLSFALLHGVFFYMQTCLLVHGCLSQLLSLQFVLLPLLPLPVPPPLHLLLLLLPTPAAAAAAISASRTWSIVKGTYEVPDYSSSCSSLYLLICSLTCLRPFFLPNYPDRGVQVAGAMARRNDWGRTPALWRCPRRKG